jgi:hypothetical protein
VLGDVSNIVQIVGFPLALIGVFLAYREGRKSRDLQAALTFADSFRSSWETSWSKALDEAEDLARRGEQPTEELREQLFTMLNWLDWVGWLIDSDVLARPQTVLASIGPQLKRAMGVVMPIMEDDEARHEVGYWHGVRTLERTLVLIERHRPLPLAQPTNSTPDTAA